MRQPPLRRSTPGSAFLLRHALRLGLVAAALSVLPATAHAATTVSGGNVSGTWSLTGSPYLVTGDITITAGTTLTVEAGVVVKLSPDVDVNVSGTLTANGTETEPVYFTSRADDSVGGDDDGNGATNGLPGDWSGIGTTNGTVNLTWTTVRYGGAGAVGCTTCGNLRMNDTALPVTVATLVNSSFTHSAASGVVGQNNVLVSMSGCTVTDNATYGLRVMADSVSVSVTGTTFGDNGNYAIDRVEAVELKNIADNTFVNGDGTGRYLGIVTSGGTISANATWSGTNGAPFIVAGVINFNGNATVNVGAGAAFKFAAGQWWYPYNTTLNLNGTVDAPIYLTSLKDDTVYGDTNGDGDATAPAPGDWNTIQFNNDDNGYNPAKGTWSYVTLRYGGGSTSAGMVLLRNTPTIVTFDHCTFERSASAGIALASSNGDGTARSIQFHDSVIRDNATYGMHFVSSARVSIQGTTFTDNGDWAIYGIGVERLPFLGRVLAGDTGYQAPNAFVNATKPAHAKLGIVVNGGNTTVSGTWGNDAPIVITGNPQVSGNAVINVEAGTIVKLVSGAFLYPYDATFNVNGSASAPVTFTSIKDDTIGGDTNGDGDATAPAPGDWDAVYFNNDDNGYNPARGTWSYTTVRYGGSSVGMVSIRNYPTYVTFDHCTFEHSATAGLHVVNVNGDGTDRRLNVNDSIVRNNATYGIHLAHSGRIAIQGTTFADNGSWAIHGLDINRLAFLGHLPNGDSGYTAPNVFQNADGSTDRAAIVVTGGTAVASGRWAKDGVIVVSGTPGLGNNCVIDVDAGTVVKLASTTSYVHPYDATFNVDGTADEPVYFTSLKDDTVGGDTNADDAATSPAPGDWDAIYFNNDDNGYNPARGTWSHAVTRYGGYNGGGNVEVRNWPTYVTFNDSTFERSASAGLYIPGQDGAGSDKRIVINDGLFQDNLGHGMAMNESGRVAVQGSTFRDNGGWAVYGLHVNRLAYMGRPPTGDTDYSAPNVFQNRDGGKVRAAIVVTGGTASTSGAWANDGVIVLQGQPIIGGNAVIDVEAGTVVKLSGQTSYFGPHDTTFNIDGTASAPVYFTSINDDTVGGDTNGNGDATTPAPGDWDAIYFNNDDNGYYPMSGTWSYTVVRYGGYDGGGQAQLRNTPTHVTFNDCTFERSAAAGAEVASTPGTWASPRIVFQRSSFRDNGGAGLQMNGGVFGKATQCTFGDNAGYSIYGINIADAANFATNNTFANSDGSKRTLALGILGSAATASATWPNKDAAYVLMGSSSFPSGTTLTLAPGVVVKHHPGVYFYLNGASLSAVGTAAQPIVFTSIHDDAALGDTNGDDSATTAQPRDWNYVHLNNSPSAALDHVRFSYGGSNIYGNLIWGGSTAGSIDHAVFSYGLYGLQPYQGGSATVQNSRFENNTSHGIYMAGTTDRIAVSNSVFTGNQGLSIANMSALDAQRLTENTFGDTVRPGISVRTTAVATNSSLPNLGPPYLVTGTVTVNSGATFTVAAGVVSKMAANVEMIVNGTLSADATDGAAIVFTSATDDTEHGDTDGGGASVGTPGYWRGIRVGAGNAVMRNVHLRYGGSTYGALSIESNGNAELSDSLVSQNVWGVSCNAARGTISRSTLTQNSEAVHVHANGCANLVISGAHANRNSLFGNTSYAVANYSTVDVNALHNYWGHRLGPTHSSNPNGQGDPVTDYVLFGPFTWVTADAGVDGSVVEGQVATLDGQGSFDPDGLAVSYSWSQTGGPTVTLSSTTAMRPTFTAPPVDAETELTFSLTASAEGVTSQPDEVVITVVPVNDPPTADAGADRSVLRNELVPLSGSGSDINLDSIVAYGWRQVSGPAVTISQASTATPYFVAPNVTSTAVVTLELTVQDHEGAWSAPDPIAITVQTQDSPRIVTSVGGAADGFDYLTSGEEVVIGETITLAGAGLDDVTTVQVNGAFVTFQGDATSLTFTVPPGTRRGPMDLRLNGVKVPAAESITILELAGLINASTTLAIYDAATMTQVATRTLPTSSDFESHPLRTSPSGRWLLASRSITSSPAESLVRIDLVTGTVGAAITLGNFGIVDAFDFVDETHVATVSGCLGALHTVDLAAGTRSALLYLNGAGANSGYGSDVAVVPSQPFAIAANDSVSKVTVVSLADMATPTIHQTIDLGALSAAQGGGTGASSVAATPDGRFILVTNGASDTVSVIEITETGTFTVRAPALAVGDNPQAIDVSDNGDFAYVLNDTPTAGNDSLSVIDLRGAAPVVLGAPVAGLTTNTYANSEYSCAGGTSERNGVLMDVSFTGDRVFVATGVGGASQVYQVVFPPDFPDSSATVRTHASTIGVTKGVAVQPGMIDDTVAPRLVEVSLHDTDGVLAAGAGDYISFRYSELVSSGDLAAALTTTGTLAELVAQLGSFSAPGTLTASAATLVVADDTIRVVLGGTVAGTMDPGGTFTPLAASVDDASGNALSDTTPVTVTQGFAYDLEPVFSAAQVSDNNHVRVDFDQPVNGASDAACWTVTYPPGLTLPVSSVSVQSSTRVELVTQAAMLVGFTYTVSACASIVDAVNGLSVNNARSSGTFVAVDRTPPTFAGLAGAVDAATLRAADGEVDLSWSPATDNGGGSIRYRIYYSLASQDPLASAYKKTVVDTTSAKVSGLATNQAYAFVVRAEDAAGNRDTNVVTMTATPTDTAPPYWTGAQGITSAVDPNEYGTVVITFGSAQDLSSGPVTYNVYVASSLGELFNAAPAASIDWVSSYKVTGLLNGPTYYFGVRAVDALGNEDGNTSYRTGVSGFDDRPPLFDGLVTATDDASDGRVVLSWTAGTESQTPPLTYNIYWSTTPDAGLSGNPLVSGYADTTYTVAGLQNGTQYYFAVRAEDGVGNEDTNTVVLDATPTLDGAPPIFVGIQSAVDMGANATVLVTWTATTDPKSPPVTYDLYYGTDEATLFDTVRVASLGASVTQYTVSGLSAGTPYFFAVRVKDARGNSDTNTVRLSATPTLDTTAPTFAGITLAQPGASGSVDLLWSQASESASPPVRYRVYIGTDAATLFDGAYTARIAYGSTRCASGVYAQYCATGLVNGTTYYFGVRAEDNAGNVDTNTVALSAIPADVAPPQISNIQVTPTTALAGDVVTIRFTVSEPLAADPAVAVSVDDVGGTTPATLAQKDGSTYTFTYGVTGTESEGARTITIAVTDLASNDAQATRSVTFDFTQDLTPPAVSFLAPVDGDLVNTAQPDIGIAFDDTAGGTDPAASGLACATIQLKLDNTQVFSGCTAYDATTGIGFSASGTPANLLRYRPPTALTAGTHLVSARAADVDGNDSGWQSITFTVVPPEQLVVSPATARLVSTQTQTFTASWSGDLGSCTWSAAGAGGNLSTTSGPSVVYQPTAAPGSYSLTVSCTDTDGSSQQATASIQILNLLSISPAIATIPAGGQQLFSAVSDVGGTYSWQLSGGGSLVVGTDDTAVTFQAGTTAGRFFLTVTDLTNNLSQTATINVIPPDYDIGRAIIVGGGSIGDHLWSDTRTLTEYAYSVLESRGFSDDRIYFLTQPTSSDIDGDGLAEVDALATTSAVDGLEYAITNWAASTPGSPLFIYLVDHGGSGSMWLHDADGDGEADTSELLLASELDAWLDVLAPGTPIVVLYEACKSGSFVETLAGPDRVILSTAGFENATIALDGNISFSQYWLAALAAGKTVGEAFDLAAAAMALVSSQVPQLDDDADGLGNGPLDGDIADGTFVGLPFAGDVLGISVASVSAQRQVGSAPATRGERVYVAAQVTSTSAITEVYALVVPPSYTPPPPSDQFTTPELTFARVTLLPASGGGFLGLTPPLDELGTYKFIVYAKDSAGQQALPRQATLSVINPGPVLSGLLPADRATGVRIDTPVRFTLSDTDGVDWGATKLFIDDIDVSADLLLSGTTASVEVYYPVGAANEHPAASTVGLRIETRDLASPSVSASYAASFSTAGGLVTTSHQPAPYSSGNATDAVISVHVVDQSGFGIHPGTLELRIDGVVVPALVTEGDPVNQPGSLEEFVLTYVPATPFADGALVEVEVHAADTAGHVMAPDVYWFTVGGSSADTTPPTVTSLAPQDGATGVSASASITLTVDDDVFVSFPSITVTLTPSSGTGTSYVFDGCNLSCAPDAVLGAKRANCVLDPPGYFADGDTIGVTIAARDGAGNAMTPVLASFTVTGENDAPQLTGRAPVPGATNVALTTPVSFHLVDVGSGVDDSSIAVTVNGVAATPMVTGSPSDYLVTWDNGGAPLTYSTTYAVSAGAADRSSPANVMSPQTWSFTTDTGLRVTEVSPANRTQGVPVTTDIGLRLVDLASPDVHIDLGSLRLYVDGQLVSPVVSGSDSDARLSYQPASHLPYGKTIQVELRASDTHGNAMPPHRFNFSTVADTEPPYVEVLAPAPSAVGVAADSAVSFNLLDAHAGAALTSLTVQIGATTYRRSSAELSAQPRSDGYLITIVPADVFYAGDVVPVVINAADVVGNAMAQVAYSFTVGNETDPPVASFLAPLCPTGGATGVSPHMPIIVSLGDAGAGVDMASIDLRVDGATVSPQLAGSSRELTLTHRASLTHGQTVTSSITAKDLTSGGNTLSPPVSHTFTTTTATDGDGDGMPDQFEVCYFAEGVGALASGDADSDGANNLAEYLDGTNPRDPADVKSVSPDAYEVDDAASLAGAITAGGATQLHNFHQAGDADWLSFTVTPGRTYRIATSALQGRCDTVVALYDATGTSVLAFNNDASAGNAASEVVFRTPAGADPLTYLVRVTHADPQVFGAFTGYTVGVFVDADPPVITDVVPAAGSQITALTPALSAVISDADSGVDPTTVSVAVDDVLCPHLFEAATGAVSCTVTSALSAGTHVLDISARDVTGNRGTSRTIFVVTDFALAPSSLSVTQDGPPAALDVEGGADPLTWAASGGTLAVDPDGRGAAFTPGSTPGEFTITVTDANGRQATAAVSVTARLAILPSFVAVGPSEAVSLHAVFADGGTDFTWSATGGSLDVTTGADVVYTSGAAAGMFTVQVTENTTSAMANAAVSILSTNVGQAVILAATEGLEPTAALAVQANAEHAYRAMVRRGFNRERIHFYSGSHGVAFDGDENGASDDVDGLLTKTAVNELFAATLPAKLSSAAPLVVYLVGGASTADAFELNASEHLTYVELRDFVAELEASPGMRHFVLVADTDNAGAAVPVLAGTQRVLVTSTHASEPAFHGALNQASFSYAFFNRVFVGESVGDAFTAARGTIQVFGATQTPQLDDDADGLANQKADGPLASVTYIGEPGLGSGGLPVIAAHSADQALTSGTQAQLWAEVLSAELLDSVQVTIVPPSTSGDPSQTLTMSYDQASGEHQLTFNGFVRSGVYRVIYSARDIRGRVSLPAESTVTTPGPYVSDLYPAPQSVGSATNTKLYFTLRDALSPIDLSTLEVLVDGVAVACTTSASDAQRVYVSCDPSTTFALGASVSVSIAVANGAGVAMPAYTYGFTITNGVDTDGDGLPDDFQDLLGTDRAPSGDADRDGVSNAQEFAQGTNPIESYPPDAFEDDDAPAQASTITVGTSQQHTFHDAGDEDWVVFACAPFTFYEVATSNLGARADTVLELYLGDGVTLVRENDDYGVVGRESRLLAACTSAGDLYVRVRSYDPGTFGPLTDYTLEVSPTVAAFGALYGELVDAVTGQQVSDGQLDADLGFDRVSGRPFPDGTYFIDLPPGNGYRLIVTAPGYVERVVENVTVGANTFTHLTVTLQPSGGVTDTDGDGIPDAWETQYGLDPDDPADALLDSDGDGRINRDEYLNRTDPLTSNAPSAPVVKSPLDDASVTAPVTLTVYNSTDIDSTALVYYFALYDEAAHTVLVEESEPIAGGAGETSWSPSVSLSVGSTYLWVVYASDGALVGPATSARFHLVEPSQPPTAPIPFSPPDASAVSSLAPTLEVVNASDVDDDVQSYRFEVYADAELTQLAASSPEVAQTQTRTSWVVDPQLVDGGVYHWRARARDGAGQDGPWSETWSFEVDEGNALPPAPIFLAPASDGETLAANPPALVIDGVRIDADGEPVTYSFLVDVEPGFQSGLRQEAVGIIPDPSGEARWTPAGPLDPALTYYVRVVGTDGRGFGPAAESSFRVSATGETLPAPALLSPIGLASTGTKPTLVAARVEGAATYELEVFADVAMRTRVTGATGVTDDGAEARWTVDVELTPGAAYVWRARAVDADGDVGEWSELAMFYVDGSARGCHCGETGADPALTLLVGALALLWLVRRRRAN